MGKRWKKARVTAACAVLAVLAPGHAALADTDLNDYMLYGVCGNDHLISYDFAASSMTDVGAIRFENDDLVEDVQGMALISGHLNIFGFWTDTDNEVTRLIYINREDARASVVGNDFGPGVVTGATISGLDYDGELNNQLVSADGAININPNNSNDNQFTLETSDGTITRDDLHQSADIDSNGTLYSGPATQIRVKPKGNGNQNGMTVDGTSYNFDNGELYVISGANMNVRLYNDHVHNNGNAMGHWWIEFNAPADVTINLDGGIFALQDVEATEDVPVDFDIVGGSVIPSEDYALKFTVLGAAISSGGSYDLPVTTLAKVGGTDHELFGDPDKARNGNVNDDENPRSYIFDDLIAADTSVAFLGTSWIKKKYWYSGNSNNHWKKYLTVDSSSNSPAVLVLRNGDTVPSIDPFLDQAEITDFIRDYIVPDETDPNIANVVLDENQAIFLYELGTTDLNSSAADFQDLVVLVTLAHDPAELVEDDDDDDQAAPSSRLIKVNPLTGGHEQVMTLDRDYDSLAANPNGMFYASSSDQLYELDPFNQTENHIGSLPISAPDAMKAFEAVGEDFYGFVIVCDKLVQIDVTSGAQVGYMFPIAAVDLETIVFTEALAAPVAFVSFD